MNELAAAREIGAPLAPYSRHFEAPRWWPEWIAQVLSTAGAPRRRALAPAPAPESPPAGYEAAAAALRTALALLRDAEAGAPDALPLAVARQEAYLARRALRVELDLALGDGPGTRLEWCGCAATRGARD